MASIALPRSQARTPSGVMAWLTTVDHKKIGIMYLYTTFFFFVIGGALALLMRTQLAVGNNHFLAPQTYNEIMTLHGTTMIFLWIIPVFSGFGNYFVPLMIGARDMAFPRINAFSFWLIPLGGLTMYSGLLTKYGAAAAGWTGYVPLTEKAYALGVGQDLWILGLHILGISSIMGAINFLVTIHNMRAPGMTWFRLPLFVWSVEITAALTVLASPFLAGVLGMVLMDRQLGTHFFTHGADPLLYQFIFWFYSHPAVYIMILPAFGIVSEVIPVFSRKPIFGYEFVAGSTVAIALLSYGVWAHHMFAVGLGHPFDAAFSGASLLIAVPTGVKIFNWIATMWGGSIRFTTSMLFAVGFLVLFTLGGISGVMVAVVPIDWQVTDSYFVVAHMHYVLFGGTAFAVLAGVYYWLDRKSVV